jgi:predicted SnoaL-like aldol condensation-catalyzing enzyme
MTARKMSPKDIVETANRLLVSKRGLEAVERYFGADYIDHNPDTPGGNLEGLVQVLRTQGFTEEAPNDRQLELQIDHLICEGEYVLVHQHIAEPGKPVLVFMDLFRVRDGKIVEHWDVIQPVPHSPANKRVTMY